MRSGSGSWVRAGLAPLVPCRSAAGGCADAGAVAVGVLDDPVRRGRAVADKASPGVQDCLQASFALVVGNPHVEVPALFQRLLRERVGLIVAVRFQPPHRGQMAAGVDRLAVFHLAAEQGCIERRELRPERGIEPELQLGQAAGVGVDAELCCVAADLACEVEVAAGDTAGVVAGERDNHVGVGELNVRVVVGGLGGGTDLVDQREAGSEVAGAEPSLDASKDLPPVRETRRRGPASRTTSPGVRT